MVTMVGENVVAIIDTGVTKSFVNEEEAKRLGTERTTQVRQKDVKEAVEAVVKFGNEVHHSELLIRSGLVDGVALGRDYLAKANTEWILQRVSSCKVS